MIAEFFGPDSPPPKKKQKTFAATGTSQSCRARPSPLALEPFDLGTLAAGHQSDCNHVWQKCLKSVLEDILGRGLGNNLGPKGKKHLTKLSEPWKSKAVVGFEIPMAIITLKERSKPSWFFREKHAGVDVWLPWRLANTCVYTELFCIWWASLEADTPTGKPCTTAGCFPIPCSFGCVCYRE